MIHPTAVIHRGAELDPSVVVGPYAVIDEGVALGARCRVGPHVHLTGLTHAGPDNTFHAGCVIGDAPQDIRYSGAPTRLRIGEGNTFREHVTVHRSNKLEEDTVLGSHNFLMANCHVGHNVQLGNHVIIANGALLAGHVTVEDRAFISGNCLLHQFVRVGRLALMQGSAGISKDLPPFTIARRQNGICGLNVIGLRRAGVTPAERLELKILYRRLFRTSGRLGDLVDAARKEFRTEPSRHLLDFVAAAKRGVCRDTGQDPEEGD
jgi:UDP-N-acetylglucosamine acyltransferase